MSHSPALPASGSVEALIAAIQALPWSAHLVAGIALLAGIVLWGAGRTVLKPLFCIAGGIALGFAGHTLGSAMSLQEVGTLPTPFVGAAVGGIVGMVLAAALFPLAVGISFAGTAAVTAVLIAGTALELHPQATSAVREAIDAEQAYLSAAQAEHDAITAANRPVRPASLAGQAAVVAAVMRDRFMAQWTEMGGGARFTLMIAGAGAALGAFVVGVLLPRRCAAATTALLGAGLWLGGGAWVLSLTDMPGHQLLSFGAKEWLVTWLCVAGVGMALQLQRITKPKEA